MTVLNPRVDFAFKKLFGNEENKDLLIDFINAIVSKEDQIVDLMLLNPYNHKDYPADKLSILDIKATDEHGRQYNIEMQLTDQVYYNQRVLYYWSKLYTSQLQQGDQFPDLKKTISINILNFNYFDQEADYHNIFKILNVKSYRGYFEDLELHFIELEKFDKDIQHLKTALDRWANFLKRAHKYTREDLPAAMQGEPSIAKAFHVLETLYLTKDERDVYEARLKWLRDEEAALIKAHLDGKAEGISEGITQASRQIAKNLLLAGIDPELVEKMIKLQDSTGSE